MWYIYIMEYYLAIKKMKFSVLTHKMGRMRVPASTELVRPEYMLRPWRWKHDGVSSLGTRAQAGPSLLYRLSRLTPSHSPSGSEILGFLLMIL